MRCSVTRNSVRVMFFHGLLSLAAILIPESTSAAGVYKWVDENGKVHYSDRPQGSKSQSIDIKSAPEAGQSEEARRRKRDKLLNVYAEERQERREKAEQKKQEIKKRKQRCNQSRDRLAGYERASYLYNLDEDGNRVVMNDKQRAALTRRAQASVKKWCK